MNSFQKVKISELGKIITGKTPKTSDKDNFGGNTFFLTPSDNMNEKYIYQTKRYVSDKGKATLKKIILPKDSICVSCIGSDLGKVVLTTGETITNQQINSIIVDSSKHDVNYIYYSATILGKILNYHSKTSTAVPIINKTNFSNYTISCPNLQTQKKIASILSALDDKIELNNKINKNLEEMAQAIFKSWFVDFEPWGGEMPKDWEYGTLGEIANITMGQSPKGSSYNDIGNGILFFQGKTDFSVRYPTPRLYTTDPKRFAEPNDILMSVRAPVGTINIAKQKCCIGRGLCSIKSKKNQQSFILYAMFKLQRKLEIFNNEGTVFGSINKKGVNSLPIIKPSINVIEQYENIISPIDKMIKENFEEIYTLIAIRDALLPKLMLGELDVSNLNI